MHVFSREYHWSTDASIVRCLVVLLLALDMRTGDDDDHITDGFSFLLTTAVRMDGGAIPARMYRQAVSICWFESTPFLQNSIHFVAMS